MNRSPRLLVVLLVLACAAGCANIPESTPPRFVTELPQVASRVVDNPSPGLNPYGLVGEFVTKTGSSEAARAYLTPEASATWSGTRERIIIEDEPKTLPQSVPEGDRVNEQVVILTGRQIGRLDPRQAFFASVQPVEYQFTVARQADGQWRISKAPDFALITEAAFVASYRRVNLVFFDPGEKVLVPDLRFMAAEPRDSLESRVVDLLLEGPSDGLKGAVVSQLDGVGLRTNVVTDSDGAIKVNFASVDKTAEERGKLAAQVVTTLSEVTTNPIRLLSDDRALVATKQDWRASDISPYENLTTSKPDLLGLAVTGGRLVSLRDGKPVDGPAGSGAYDVVTAAQSLDGSALAVVQRTGSGVRLRVGKVDGDLPEVGLSQAATLTRPTWLLSPGEGIAPNEVWTVQDGTIVTRVVRTVEGTWVGFPVEATELTRDGTITQLRLSRDGVRVAAVVNGQVRVASVVRTNDAVAIRSPLTLQAGVVKQVVGLDWLDRQTLIAATEQASLPVASLPIDGFSLTQFNSANLTLPVTAVTAAPSRSTLVMDSLGLWSTQEANKVWLTHQHGQPPGSIPFYPG
ncbi:LpqB family beta-propeller domain-containing protein [Actinokineospora sp. PR83]|uniref:LpqB family beta-propeller domain-containing protein n=1 Tax=Actinokineospora sp. PR83 TaxID=2884908 RepID=UPI0027E0A028|nr:LpqB family beta-propeller domain-containing protein [Actinokineospora sp. PR83]MCG8916135.1 LpqB family beta-propeller domain-containing protein [Actinokineospora sp. PR83]